MSKREFYRSVVIIEIVSEDPLGDDITLDGIQYLINNECSGHIECEMNEKINAEKTVNILQKHGSDPGFFKLSDNGEDLNEED